MLLSGLSQGSFLGLLLFSLYIRHMFFETPASMYFAGYVDENTHYTLFK